jgi:hypothetical protein
MEKETLKSLRAKAKELRSKVSSAPLSKATPDQLRSEILMLERAVKAEEKVALRKALKEAQVVKPVEKKKTSVAPVVQKAVQKTKTVEEREKELLKREKELAKKEKLLQSKALASSPRQEKSEDTESESDDY